MPGRPRKSRAKAVAAKAPSRSASAAKAQPAKAQPAKAQPAKAPPAKAQRGQVYAPDRAAWRTWLAANHAASTGIWLIFHKKSANPDRLAYGDAVEEALCFGWIDSIVHTIDETRYQQLFTPRKPRSTWSRSNKIRVERLLAEGLIQPAGLAAIEIARRNGSWNSLDAIDSLELPADLAAALRRVAGAKRNFDAFPVSARRGYLYWIASAKRPETRTKRIAQVVDCARQNRKLRT